MTEEIKVEVKKFVVIPRDAFDVLNSREASLERAIKLAEERCAETGMTVMVVELRAVASRADRPVTVRKL
jgi:hypothetical protein